MDSTMTHYSALGGPLEAHTVTRKISKAERTSTPHREHPEHPEITLVPLSASQSSPEPLQGAHKDRHRVTPVIAVKARRELLRPS